jgi:hypothetical protein
MKEGSITAEIRSLAVMIVPFVDDNGRVMASL